MRILLTGLAGLVAASGLAASAQASINYNASKSNTGNVAFHRHHTAQVDLGHGILVGRRRHHPLAHKPKTNPPIDANHGISTGRRMH
jgi:predicted NAD/FAD-dependent oxidoreductase